MTEAAIKETWPTVEEFRALGRKEQLATVQAKVTENRQKLSAFGDTIEWLDHLITRFTWAMEHIRFMTEHKLLRVDTKFHETHAYEHPPVFTDISLEACDALQVLVDYWQCLPVIIGLDDNWDGPLDKMYEEALGEIYVNPKALEYFSVSKTADAYKVCVDELALYVNRTSTQDDERFMQMAKALKKERDSRKTIETLMHWHSPGCLEEIDKEVARLVFEKSNLSAIVWEFLGVESRLTELQEALDKLKHE